MFKKMCMRVSLRLLAAPLAATLIASGASAATFTPCSPDAASAVSSSAGCHVIGDLGKRFDKTDLAGLFDTDTWKKRGALKKKDFPGRKRALRMRADGTWKVRKSVFRNFDNVVMVLKAGGKSVTPGAIVAYQLDGSANSGTISSPFKKLGTDTAAPIRKIWLMAGNTSPLPPVTSGGTSQALVVTPSVTPVPVPAAGLLLLTGLLGLGALARRRG